MKRKRYEIAIVLLAVCAAAGGMIHSAEPEPKADAQSTSPERRGDRAKASRLSPREQAFKAAMENSILAGTWQMTRMAEPAAGVAAKPSELSEAKSDRYTIDGVNKSTGDFWVISARVQYADKDVTIPVSVRVVWAGDTPVITLDKSALPGLGTYSARVLIDNGFYAGTWSGSNYGGVMSGRIIKQADDAASQSKPTASAPAVQPSNRP